MAQPGLRRAENVPGPFYVDATCIDCDTCRWMAPQTFVASGGQSAVNRQPVQPADLDAAARAMVSCPTASIGVAPAAPTAQGEALRQAVRRAAAAFPMHVAGSVYHAGYHDASSFGAASYLVVRPGQPGGNVLVDVPRFAAPLVAGVERLGGVGTMVFTHRDDVADHGAWAKRFGARRVLHRRDAPIPGGPVEQWLEHARGEVVEVVPGLRALPTPGHTAGHVCYEWDDPAGETMLFTGDHLAYDRVVATQRSGDLEAWPDVCWFDWGEQVESMRSLQGRAFTRILPGHGRPAHLEVPVMQAKLASLVAWMETQR